MQNVYFDSQEFHVKSFKSGFSTNHLFSFPNGYSLCVTENFKGYNLRWNVVYLYKNKKYMLLIIKLTLK